MAGVGWRLGESLDALDDMLFGGYGAAEGSGPVTVVWADHLHSARALGREATRAWYEGKAARPELFDVVRARHRIEELDRGEGPSYYDLVLEVFAGHPRVSLVLD